MFFWLSKPNLIHMFQKAKKLHHFWAKTLLIFKKSSFLYQVEFEKLRLQVLRSLKKKLFMSTVFALKFENSTPKESDEKSCFNFILVLKHLKDNLKKYNIIGK